VQKNALPGRIVGEGMSVWERQGRAELAAGILGLGYSHVGMGDMVVFVYYLHVVWGLVMV